MMSKQPYPLTYQIIVKIGGTISCFGSGYIIQDVLRNPGKRSKSTYHRIMVGLSTMDIFHSFFMFVLSSWPMPKESYLWAVGNNLSCDIVAFIGAVGYLGSQLYNCALASFYSLRLKYNFTDHEMKKTEKWLLFLPWVISILFCTIALCTKSFGPSNGKCSLAFVGYPYHCNRPQSDVECIRGGKRINNILTMCMLLVPFLCILYVSIIMFRVFWTVRNIELNSLKYSFTALHRGYDKKKTTKRSRRVMIQGLLYSVAMVLTWMFTIISFIIFLATNNTHQGIRFATAVFNPLQGLFNCLIYLVPGFAKILKERRRRSSVPPTENTQQKDEEENNKKSVTFPSVLPSPRGTTTRTIFNDKDDSNSPVNKNFAFIEEEKEEEKREIDCFPLSSPSSKNNNKNDWDIEDYVSEDEIRNDSDNNGN